MGRRIRYGLASAIQDGSILGVKLADGAVTDAKVSATAAIGKTKIASTVIGGTGADGALSITSGTTTLDLGGASYFVKNYTSISITGTGKLAFINPHANGTIIVLKSQGNVTLTSSQAPMIDCSALGGNGGAAVTSTGNSVGLVGSDGVSAWLKATGASAAPVSGASGGTGGAAAIPSFGTPTFDSRQRYANLPVASGGGSGSLNNNIGASNTSGKGGRGGGTLVIECKGSWNFTTANGISVAGENGGNGVASAYPNASGGGAGAGGYFLCLYGTLVANSGTVNVAGGIGGNNDGYNSLAGRCGGGSGSNHTVGNTGVSTNVAGAKSGADGPAGLSQIQQCVDFF